MGFQAIFKTAFPFISAAASLGGPLGTMAANAVGKAIGIDNVSPDKVDDAIAEATTKDPEAMLKLKQAEADFQLRMQELGFKQATDLLNIDAADRANARAREMAVRDRTPMILAFAITIGFFSLLGMLAFHSVPQQSEKILDIMVGSLGTAWIGIVTYYFGSSAGSQEKTRIMAESNAASRK